MSDLDIAETKLPQDGRIQLAIDGRQVDLRVATLPGIDGEGAVLRVLDRSAVNLELSALGFEERDRSRLSASTQSALNVSDACSGSPLYPGRCG